MRPPRTSQLAGAWAACSAAACAAPRLLSLWHRGGVLCLDCGFRACSAPLRVCCLTPVPTGLRLPPPCLLPPVPCRATDHTRWFETSLSYRIPYEEGFEPYVMVQRRFVPWYDERFKGYRKNKVGSSSSSSGSEGRK